MAAAPAVASTYLPVLTEKLLSDSASERVRQAALAALTPLEPALLCNHSVPVALALLQQWIQAAELAVPGTQSRTSATTRHPLREGIDDIALVPWVCALRTAASWEQREIRTLHGEDRILNLFALVKGCQIW